MMPPMHPSFITGWKTIAVLLLLAVSACAPPADTVPEPGDLAEPREATAP